MELKHKVALITGAGRGIGRALSLTLAEAGSKVVLISRSEAELAQVEYEIKAKGGTALVLAVDLTQEGCINTVVERTIEVFGQIDILINNAGICVATEFEEVTEALYDQHFLINLRVPFFLSQAVLKYMKKQGRGHIINISSTAALEIPSFHSVYGASKLGLVGFSKALYQTCKQYNIKVSIVYPHYTDTQMLRDIDPPVPSSQWMQAEDIAEGVLYLLQSPDRVVIKDLVPIAFLTEQG